MATVGELKEVLKETLQRNGVAEKIKGQVRAEVFKALDSKQSGGAVPLSDENLIINELIREYLNFNQYQETLSVLVPETGQPERPAFDRAFMVMPCIARCPTTQYCMRFSNCAGYSTRQRHVRSVRFSICT